MCIKCAARKNIHYQVAEWRTDALTLLTIDVLNQNNMFHTRMCHLEHGTFQFLIPTDGQSLMIGVGLKQLSLSD